MKFVGRSLISASFIVICVIAGTAARADDNEDRDNRSNRYMVTNLTADLPGVAPNTDPVLRNSWGVAFTPAASPFWIADKQIGRGKRIAVHSAGLGNAEVIIASPAQVLDCGREARLHKLKRHGAPPESWRWSRRDRRGTHRERN